MSRMPLAEYKPPTVSYHGRVGEVTLSHSVLIGASLAKAVATSLVGQPNAPGAGGETVVTVPGGGTNTVTHTITNNTTHTVTNHTVTNHTTTIQSPGGGNSPGSASGGGGGGSNPAGAGEAAAAKHSGGKLPFTGMAVVYVAGAGAALATAGETVRRFTRRRSADL
jgi:hypothetical protein